MMLHKKELMYKHLLSLKRREEELREQKYKIKPIKLDKPIFNGYTKELVLREEVLRRDDADKIQALLSWLGQDKAFCKNKSFIRKKGKQITEIKPRINVVLDPRYTNYYSNKSKVIYEKIQFFSKYLERHLARFCGCSGAYNSFPHYVFKFPWMLEEKISEHFLTHYYPINGEIEGELKKISDKLCENHGILYGKSDQDWSRYSSRELENRYLQKEIKKYEED